MKHWMIICAALFFSFTAAVSAQSEKLITVEVEGVGETVEKCEKNALSAAVKKAVGVLSDSVNVMENDDVAESLIEASSAYVRSIERLDGPKMGNDTLYHVKIKAVVVDSQLKKQISRFKTTSTGVDILSQIKASEKVEEQEDNLLKFYKWIYPEIYKTICVSSMKYTIGTDPRVTEKVVNFEFKLSKDPAKVEALRQKTDQVLQKIGFKKMQGRKNYGRYDYGFPAGSTAIIYDEDSEYGYMTMNQLLILRYPDYGRKKNYKYISDIIPCIKKFCIGFRDADGPNLVFFLFDKDNKPLRVDKAGIIDGFFYVREEYNNPHRAKLTELDRIRISGSTFLIACKPDIKNAVTAGLALIWQNNVIPPVIVWEQPFSGESLFAEIDSKEKNQAENGKLLVSLIQENWKQIKASATCSYDRANPETAKVKLTLEYDRRGYANFYRQAKAQLSKIAVACPRAVDNPQMLSVQPCNHYRFELRKINYQWRDPSSSDHFHFDDSTKEIRNALDNMGSFYLKLVFYSEKDEILQESLLKMPLCGKDGHKLYIPPFSYPTGFAGQAFTSDPGWMQTEFQKEPATYVIDIPFDIPDDLPLVKRIDCSVIMEKKQ